MKYVGITIGPIGEVITSASTPASLWFGSGMFSDITRRLCVEILQEKSFENVEIYSPYYDENITMEDGVGKFHDRIIFSAEDVSKERMDYIVQKVKAETKNIFPDEISVEETFLDAFLQVNYIIKDKCEMTKENCILELSPYLDAIELMQIFPIEDENPIEKVFAGKKESQNYYIKESPIFKRIKSESNQFKKDSDSIWSIEDIANCHGEMKSGLKYEKYFAVVQADGDGMGKFLKSLDDSQIAGFSKQCLLYAQDAAKKIGEFGGMTIYAGGDDLLFLAPLKDRSGRLIFELCEEINKLFQDKMKEAGYKELIPTISFGISIQYYKYPLYEALSNAAKLLFGVVKAEDENKNSIAFEVQKHSGQSFMLLVSHEEIDGFLDTVKANEVSGQELVSIVHTIAEFRTLIQTMSQKVIDNPSTKEQFTAAWMNLFDNPEQKQYKEVIESIGCRYAEMFLERTCKMQIPESARRQENYGQAVDVLIYMLQLKKFMVEEGEA